MHSKKILALLSLVVVASGYNPNPAMANANGMRVCPSTENAHAVKGCLASKDDSVLAEWKCMGEQKAVVVAVHGLGLHKRAFKNLAEQLQQHGITTYAVDVRGFGGWKAKNSSSKLSIQRSLVDIRQLLLKLHGENPGCAVFLLGESMGGAIALRVAAENAELIDGVISAVPARERVDSVKVNLTVGIKCLLGGGRKVSLNNCVVKRATTDVALQNTWEQDQDAKLELGLGELIKFSSFMGKNHEVAKRIKHTAVLLVQGDRDRLVKAEATRKLYEELPTADKELIALHNSEHLILEEGQFDQGLLSKITDWIQRHSKTPADTHLLATRNRV